MRLNFLGNMAGRLWLGLMNVATVPVFIHLLGASAFGIVSLVATLQTVLGLLDLGLAGTINREVAMLRGPEDRGRIANVVRTFELVYWMVALAIALGIAGASGWIAHSWVTDRGIPPSRTQAAIILGGVGLAARWPVAIYTGVLRGLERQVLQNAILAALATARVAATVLALLFVSPTIYCFLIVQAAANGAEALLSGGVAHRLLPGGGGARFDLAVVKRVWRFAIGLNLVGAIGTLAVGTDKVMISRLLPLAELTYYSVAGTAAGALQVVSIAAETCLFPRMAACWKQGDKTEVLRLYRFWQRLTVYICVGPAVLLFFFPHEILSLWTRSPELAQHARLPLAILAAAFLCSSASGTPLTTMLAAGHTRTPLLVNATALPLLAAGNYLAVREFGIVGAAICWLLFTSFCTVAYARYCMKSLIRSPAAPFAWGIPFELPALGAEIGAASKALLPLRTASVQLAAWLLCTLLLYYGLGAVFWGKKIKNMAVAAPGQCQAPHD